ncbi:PIN domain-containing protein [Microbacterium sp.]|uniref:PIN domain-containing protein n=1 Tax=Microbacterium sp. TaxID=51671 RepID=UPI0039E2E751
MSLQFVDTNVLVYAYDEGAGERHVQAIELVDQLGRGRSGAISVQVLQEFVVNVTRKSAVPLSMADARARVRMLSRWPTHSPLASDVVAATEIAESSRLSFWDAMIVRSAVRMECDVLWSEDLNPGQRIAGVEIRNPFAR